MAIAIGLPPTGISFTLVLFSVDITEIVLESELATYKVPGGKELIAI